MSKKTSPWFHAEQAGRNYLTPEDVNEAIDAGGTRLEIWTDVLKAIEMHAVEDASCTAFVALKLKDRIRDE